MKKITTKEITHIALGIAALISGGFLIVQIGRTFPIPGGKYIIMAPYLSLVMYLIMSKVDAKAIVLLIGSVLAMIMSLVNLYMGLAIIVTTVLTHLMTLLASNKSRKRVLASITFSGFTGGISITVSKYLMGGVFEQIPSIWVIYTSILCMIMGGLGVLLASKIAKHMGIYEV